MEKLFTAVRSYRTTVVGVLSGVGILITQIIALIDGNPETVVSETAIATALALMGLGTLAKDGDKSTEEVRK